VYRRETQNAMSEHGTGTGTRIGKEQERNWTKLETEILRVVLVILSSSTELNSRISGSV